MVAPTFRQLADETAARVVRSRDLVSRAELHTREHRLLTSGLKMLQIVSADLDQLAEDEDRRGEDANTASP